MVSSDLLRAGCDLLRELSGGQSPLALSSLAPRLTDGIVIRIRERELPVQDRVSSYLESHGVDAAPRGARIALVSEPGLPEETSATFLEDLIAVLHRRGVDQAIQVRTRSVQELEAGLAAGGGRRGIGARCDVDAVWFVLRTKTVEPAPKMFELFRRLDALRVPWRRAYADDARDYSVGDQAGSLIQAVGGVTHRIGLRGARTLPWTLGIDLSHHRDVEQSRVCVTLVGPAGRLTGAWCALQARDETARPESLRPLVRMAGERLRESGGTDVVLVIRDGKHFKGDRPALYREELETGAEVLELAKNGNPPLFEEPADGCPISPGTAVSGFHPESDWIFLLPGVTQETGGLGSVLKFRRLKGGDSSKFTDRDLAEALVALTYAPVLGSRRSNFPAPIYWADGIAGASDVDLRFRGQADVFHLR